MIQAVLLIALGFLTATLVGIVVAPSLWQRAYRLSRKRLEQSLPISLPEIEAAQDQLKASYAVRMRRLETALASARQKSAAQLVDNSRLQMQIVALKDQIGDLDLKLSERRNAATVMEQTITKRFPELDREITAAKQQLRERSYELQDFQHKLGRRGEELEAAGKAAASYQTELVRLRGALEKNSADRTGRRLRRASQWTLDDYRAEYDRLNLELSKLRQQLAQLQDKDALQAGLIKEELQKLSELILVSSQPRSDARAVEGPEIAARRTASEPRRARPVPWPGAAGEARPAIELRPVLPSTASVENTPGAEKESQGSVPEPGALSPADAKVRVEEASRTPPPRSLLLQEAASLKAAFLEQASTNGSASGAASKNGKALDASGAKDPLSDTASKEEDLQSGQAGGNAGRTLLERLRGATEETESR